MIYVCLFTLAAGSPGLTPGVRGPFHRAVSMDGKPSVGPGGGARRPVLIKQENMMGSPDGYPGNMGVCPRGLGTSNQLIHIQHARHLASFLSLSPPPILPHLPFYRACIPLAEVKWNRN